MKERSPLQKNIPNIITLFRLVFSPALLLFTPFSNSFLLLYALLGLSDVLDGFLARRWGVSGKLGARLDSAADFLLFGIILYLLVRNYRFPVWALLWVASIAILRFVALAVCYARFHKLAFLHTYANKATGFLLVLSPFLLSLLGLNTSVIVVSVAASISALEELILQLTQRELNLDVVSILK